MTSDDAAVVPVGAPGRGAGAPAGVPARQWRGSMIAERAIEAGLLLAALSSVATTVGIVYVLISESVPFFGHVSVWEFLTGTVWTPLFAEAIRCIHEETSISVLFHQQWEEETRKESAEKRRLTRVVETPVAEKKKLYLTVEEVARRWRISKATLYRWIHFAGNPKLNRENYPQPAKFGRRYLWLESDLLAFEGKNPDGIRTQS